MRKVTSPNEVVVLDLDDTLFSEREYVASGFDALDRLIRTQFSVEGFYRIALGLFEQGARGKIFDLTLPQLGLTTSPQLISALLCCYRSHWPTISLFSDARAFLDRVAVDYPLAILSDGPIASQVNKSRALGLQHWCSVQIFTDIWGRSGWKPALTGFKCIHSRYPAATQFVYIGDNPAKDFFPARQLGWRTVRLRRNGGMYAQLESQPSHDADLTIGSFDMLDSRALFAPR